MSNIIVIGAGIAGLTAALELAQHKHSVTLLEARARLGGRIYTRTASDHTTPIELGASYWEGLNESPFYQRYFDASKNSGNKPYVMQLQSADSLFVDLDSPLKNPLTPLEIQTYYQLAETILHKAYQTRLGKTFAQVIDDCELPSNKQQSYWLKKILELQCIHQSTPLSAIGFPDFQIPPINLLNAYNEASANFCFVGNGFHRVVKQIADEATLAGVKIIPECAVLKITDLNDKGVLLHATQGDFNADKIICTMPIGVLKTQATTLFSPALSFEKLQAIANMGVHASTRVVLEFETPFWDKQDCPYILLSTANKAGLREFRNNYALHQKAILQTPSYANEAKAMDDNALIEFILSELRAAFPKNNVPFPKFSIVHRWGDDPFAQGAYPYRTLKMNEENHQALERPQGNIYFAGADLSRFGFSVQHAYASGKDVAMKLLHVLECH